MYDILAVSSRAELHVTYAYCELTPLSPPASGVYHNPSSSQVLLPTLCDAPQGNTHIPHTHRHEESLVGLLGQGRIAIADGAAQPAPRGKRARAPENLLCQQWKLDTDGDLHHTKEQNKNAVFSDQQACPEQQRTTRYPNPKPKTLTRHVA